MSLYRIKTSSLSGEATGEHISKCADDQEAIWLVDRFCKLGVSSEAWLDDRLVGKACAPPLAARAARSESALVARDPDGNPTGTLTVAQMRAYVALSRGHVEKQELLITRLTAQGHVEMADQARDLLVTMNGHLETEVLMLARLEIKDGTAAGARGSLRPSSWT